MHFVIAFMQTYEDILMDWNALKVFLAIADKGSLSGAANQLNVNHSTIFRRLGSFEEEIGGRLFERINNRYMLTPTGQELLAYAKRIEEAFHDVERQIAGKDIQAKGVVKITAPSNIASQYLSRYLTEFTTLHRDIQIELLASNLEFNMKNRQADIAVRATNKPPEYLIGKQVCEIGWSVFGSAPYQKRFGHPHSLNELSQHRILGATGSIRHLSTFTWIEKHLPEQIISRCDDLTVMSRFVESGHGLAILPNDQDSPNIEKLFTFSPEKPSNLWLLTHPDLRKVARIKLVMEFLTHAFSLEQLQ